VHESQKESSPRFDEHDAAVGAQTRCISEKVDRDRQVRRGDGADTLNDEDILAAIRERKLAAVGNRAFRGAFELRESGREVTPSRSVKPRPGERSNRFRGRRKARRSRRRAAIAKRPIDEARDKLFEFPARVFETQIRLLPKVGDERARRVHIQTVGPVFHL